MDPRKLFIDERLRDNCAYCGAAVDSRDHVPSRVLLDEPFPENLPVVESCTKCNAGFSVNEEYLACLIECAIYGTTQPDSRFRDTVARTLIARPSIAARIESSKVIGQDGSVAWRPEWERVKEVVLKLARGHMSYELGLQHIEDPAIIDIVPIPGMAEGELVKFNSLDEEDTGVLYPEIGSRAFISLRSGKPTAYAGWRVVQDGRYRYAIGQSSGDWVRFVLSEYLACRVVWE